MKIHRALEERWLEGTSIQKLALKYGVANSTLSDRAPGRPTLQEGHAHRQILSPAMGKALENCGQQLDDWEFPQRFNLLRAMASALAQTRAEEGNDPELASRANSGSGVFSAAIPPSPQSREPS